MKTFKINVSGRRYESYDIFESDTLAPATIRGLDPASSKLFNHDIFTIAGSTVAIVHSSTRSMSTMPGVLVLDSGKTFGKHKSKFLYKCVPDDRRLPVFLVPFSIKAGFNKHTSNRYVVFKFNHWKDRHPRGSLVQVIGCVAVLDHFYEYQLYCKSLYASIQKFTKDTMQQLRAASTEQFIRKISDTYGAANRELWDVVSVDPIGSKDFDDAFSFITISKTEVVLSVYIANVPFWLDALDLWNSFSRRVATIYLPDRRRPMLPTILSDALCSLQEGQTRFAFAMDVTINPATSEIKKVDFLSARIKVQHNLRYDTPEQEENTLYREVASVVRALNSRLRYVENIRNSHDVVAYLMLLMNRLAAERLKTFAKGIFRSITCNPCPDIPPAVPLGVRSFVKGWNSGGGVYCSHDNLSGHEMLKFDAYVHITSPIRRLVDLLNIMQLQTSLGIWRPGEKARAFHDEWSSASSLQYINKTMRSIRRVQNDCSLLHVCTTNGDILEKKHEGFIFDKISRNDGLYQYMVYLPDIKMVSRFTSRHDEHNYSQRVFRVHLFMDEDQLKQKVRVALC